MQRSVSSAPAQFLPPVGWSSSLVCSMTEEREAAVNRYGTLAMRQWRDYMPARYEALEDPEEFFRELGELVETRITALVRELERSLPTTLDYLQRVADLTAARRQAEEIVLQELIFSQVEPEPSRDLQARLEELLVELPDQAQIDSLIMDLISDLEMAASEQMLAWDAQQPTRMFSDTDPRLWPSRPEFHLKWTRAYDQRYNPQHPDYSPDRDPRYNPTYRPIYNTDYRTFSDRIEPLDLNAILMDPETRSRLDQLLRLRELVTIPQDMTPEQLLERITLLEETPPPPGSFTTNLF